MEAFWSIGMSIGVTGFIFALIGLTSALSALAKISKLERQLKETGVLDKKYKSGGIGSSSELV